MKSIAVFGPHDRFNYGDFLFSFMFTFAVKKRSIKNFHFDNYSIINSDFSDVGAFSSKSYRTLKKSINKNETKVVVIAGGEVLSVSWENLLYYISNFYKKLKRTRLIGKVLNKIEFSRRYIGGSSEYPFCINKKDFKKNFKIIYNSVGGSSNQTLSSIQVKALKDADYISVRDLKTQNILKQYAVKSFLVPDSACILSDVFDIKAFCSEKVDRKYIFFQISNIYHQGKIQEIASQLEELNVKYKFHILLCPIGIANGHEDHIVLKKISSLLSFKHTFIKNPNIHNIICLIANAQFYFGSSLHGIITAMNYGVPYIPLNKKQKKIESYLNTWSIEELKRIYHPDSFIIDMDELIKNRKNLSEKIITQNIFLKNEYYASIDRILKII